MLSSCSQGKSGCSVCRDMQRRLWDSQERVRQKRGSICQGLQSVEYSSNQTLAYIGVTKKKLSSFCLQRTTCITQEKPGTVIRSQMILEFWNIWRLDFSFLWATGQNFLLSGSFGHPYGREGGWLFIREPLE